MSKRSNKRAMRGVPALDNVEYCGFLPSIRSDFISFCRQVGKTHGLDMDWPKGHFFCTLVLCTRNTASSLDLKPKHHFASI